MTGTTMTTTAEKPTHAKSAARTVVAIVSTLFIVASAYAPLLVGMNPPPYELNITILTQGILALLGFFGLIATSARPRYLVVSLILTAVPAIMAMGFLGFSALVGWTNGVHTFVESWDPLSHAFAYTAPFFMPTLVTGALLIIRKRPTWVKLLVVVLAIGVLYALCVYRWFFS